MNMPFKSNADQELKIFTLTTHLNKKGGNPYIKLRDQYLDQAKALFATAYPEYIDPKHPDFDPDLAEDFKTQLGKDGFFKVAINVTTDQVEALSAGALMSESKTAIGTYNVSANEKARAFLQSATHESLNDDGYRAVFTEIYQESNPRNDAEKAAQLALGAQKIPVSYAQPVSEEGEKTLSNMDLYGYFAQSTTPDEQKELTRGFLKDFVKLYDAEVALKTNQNLLARWNRQLTTASFAPGNKPGLDNPS